LAGIAKGEIVIHFDRQRGRGSVPSCGNPFPVGLPGQPQARGKAKQSSSRTDLGRLAQSLEFAESEAIRFRPAHSDSRAAWSARIYGHRFLERCDRPGGVTSPTKNATVASAQRHGISFSNLYWEPDGQNPSAPPKCFQWPASAHKTKLEQELEL